MAVSSCEMIRRLEEDTSLLLPLPFTQGNSSSGMFETNQEWYLFFNGFHWFDQEKKSLFESVDPFSWQGFSISFHRGTLFDLGDSCCSAPRCSLLL